MAKAHEAWQVGNARTVLEDSGGHAVAFALVEAATGTAADYAGSVLAAVLEEIEGIVHLDRRRLRLRIAVDDCDNTAHFEVIYKRKGIGGSLEEGWSARTRQFGGPERAEEAELTVGSLRKSLCAQTAEAVASLTSLYMTKSS